MDYDFVEIGAYCADTLADTALANTRGLLIEPIQGYLDLIPFHPTITKVAVAIVDENTKAPLLYYIEPDDIKRHKLHPWIAQCNMIGAPHPWHLRYTEAWDHTGQSRDLTQLGIVRVCTVPTMTFTELVIKYEISSIKVLKIDAEGFDCKIINSMLNYTTILPKKIQFETNEIGGSEEIQLTRERLSYLGYTHTVDGQNTISTRM
jgi:FkbM family methyltransferase